MSKLARDLINIKDVRIEQNNKKITFRGNEGENSIDLHPTVSIEIKDDNLKVNGTNAAMLGTFFRIIQWCVQGVRKKFEKILILNGIGYKAQKDSNTLKLFLGFEQESIINIPEGISAEIGKDGNNPSVIIKSCNKQILGNFAQILCKIRKYSPYKQTGVFEKGKFKIIKKRKAK